MRMKVPSCLGNSFIGAGDSNPYESDIEEEYYSTPSNDDETDDFSDYLWMENEEEFDSQEILKLEEEELMQECIEWKLEEELLQVEDEQDNESLNQLCDVIAKDSSLNPLAQEFVPSVVVSSN